MLPDTLVMERFFDEVGDMHGHSFPLWQSLEQGLGTGVKEKFVSHLTLNSSSS